ncbi:hypothetical protein [Achromobacter aloeverae]|uniref:Uncharacterized protein n=1 Tax=Achromobacter aloeverae TaxID=1750518 RepID=A0A4Q1HFK4_9BURK|nr:hypothetical protein [Achromobacter aloeverae]RXN85419.1 hypothetical protein C7R54_23330 [Achromobacter aloeverae]
MSKYPTSPPPENREAARKNLEREQTSGAGDEVDLDREAPTPTEPDARGYETPHSGRRAAGHGGGSLDASEGGADYAVAPGAEFSGGGQGHAPQASQQREAEQELAGRTGPYVRSGRMGENPAGKLAGRPSASGDRDGGPDTSNESDDQDAGPPRTPAPAR